MSENEKKPFSLDLLLKARQRRKWMREASLGYRAAIQPGRFDGTLETYHRNMDRAMECLKRAVFWRELFKDLDVN